MPGVPSLHSYSSHSTLTPEQVRHLQIITGALMTSVLMFLAVVMVIVSQARQDFPEAEQTDLIGTLSLAHGLFGIGVYMAAAILPRRLISQNWSTTGEGSDPFAIIRTTRIIRLALLEGVAMFGLAVCLLAGLNGVMTHFPEYWLNAGSTVVLLGTAILTFPTKDRLETTLREMMSIGMHS